MIILPVHNNLVVPLVPHSPISYELVKHHIWKLYFNHYHNYLFFELIFDFFSIINNVYVFIFQEFFLNLLYGGNELKDCLFYRQEFFHHLPRYHAIIKD